MAILRESLLFQWRDIDSADDLSRFLLVRDNLPDARLVDFLEKRRGKGRDDYPVRPMWNLVLAGVVFQHPSAAALLREASRNPALREACGFNPFPRKRLKKVEGKWVEVMEAEVPSDDAFGRFLALLIEHRSLIDDMFHACLDELAALLPDLGEKLAVDSKAIQSAGKPVKDEEKQETPDGRRDLDADWGKKEYKGTRKDGTPFEKVVTWFGYKLHLLVDSKYEMPLAFKLTKASAADGPELLPLIEQHEERNPETASRADEVAADKAYDSKENNEALYDDHGIKPVIDNRRLWKEDPEKPRTLFGDRYDVVSYDEGGHVYCCCPVTGEQRELAFVGFEKDRGTLKYRCPAAAFGFVCPGRAKCEKCAPDGVGPFGRVFRVPLSFDRRIFTPIARHTPKWENAYDRRTAVERVNARIDRVLGFELHFIRGQAKMEMRVSLALTVLLAMALGRIRANQADLMRSLTAKVQRTGA
jgi:hypothetical protein